MATESWLYHIFM